MKALVVIVSILLFSGVPTIGAYTDHAEKLYEKEWIFCLWIYAWSNHPTNSTITTTIDYLGYGAMPMEWGDSINTELGKKPKLVAIYCSLGKYQEHEVSIT